MERDLDKSPVGEIADLGSVSAETKGPPGGTVDEVGGLAVAGLSDD